MATLHYRGSQIYSKRSRIQLYILHIKASKRLTLVSSFDSYSSYWACFCENSNNGLAVFASRARNSGL